MVLIDIYEMDIFQVRDIIQIKVLDSASDEFEGGEHIDQFIEIEIFFVILLVFFEDWA